MSVSELRKLSSKEISTKVSEEQEKLVEMKFKHANNELEDTSQIAKQKKVVAQLQTIKNEKRGEDNDN